MGVCSFGLTEPVLVKVGVGVCMCVFFSTTSNDRLKKYQILNNGQWSSSSLCSFEPNSELHSKMNARISFSYWRFIICFISYLVKCQCSFFSVRQCKWPVLFVIGHFVAACFRIVGRRNFNIWKIFNYIIRWLKFYFPCIWNNSETELDIFSSHIQLNGGFGTFLFFFLFQIIDPYPSANCQLHQKQCSTKY